MQNPKANPKALPQSLPPTASDAQPDRRIVVVSDDSDEFAEQVSRVVFASDSRRMRVGFAFKNISLCRMPG